MDGRGPRCPQPRRRGGVAALAAGALALSLALVWAAPARAQVPTCLEALQAASLHVGYLERYRGAEERDFAATHAALLREIERLKAELAAAVKSADPRGSGAPPPAPSAPAPKSGP